MTHQYQIRNIEPTHLESPPVIYHSENELVGITGILQIPEGNETGECIILRIHQTYEQRIVRFFCKRINERPEFPPPQAEENEYLLSYRIMPHNPKESEGNSEDYILVGEYIFARRFATGKIKTGGLPYKTVDKKEIDVNNDGNAQWF